MKSNKKLLIVYFNYEKGTYFNHKKSLKFLKEFGFITYYSKQMKYAYLYIEKNNADSLIKKISNSSYVKSIDISHAFDTSFEKESQSI